MSNTQNITGGPGITTTTLNSSTVNTGAVNATSVTTSGTTFAKRIQVGQSDVFGAIIEQIGGGTMRFRPVPNQDGCSMLFTATSFGYRNGANQTAFMIDPVNNNGYFSWLQGLYIGDNHCSTLRLTATKASGIIQLQSNAGVTCDNTLDRVARQVNARSGGAGIATGTWTTALWTTVDANNSGLTYAAGVWTNPTSTSKLCVISYTIAWDNNTGGTRASRVVHTGGAQGIFGTATTLAAGSANQTQLNGSCIINLSQNQYFNIDIWQDCGGTLSHGQAANGVPAGSSTRLQVAII
jgi:hypothetical protein